MQRWKLWLAISHTGQEVCPRNGNSGISVLLIISLWRWGRWILVLGESWSPMSVKKVEHSPPLPFSPGIIKVSTSALESKKLKLPQNLHHKTLLLRLYELDSENIMELISWCFLHISKTNKSLNNCTISDIFRKHFCLNEYIVSFYRVPFTHIDFWWQTPLSEWILPKAWRQPAWVPCGLQFGCITLTIRCLVKVILYFRCDRCQWVKACWI